jgi:hypothetical protein
MIERSPGPSIAGLRGAVACIARHSARIAFRGLPLRYHATILRFA